jgi:hypothetical protein
MGNTRTKSLCSRGDMCLWISAAYSVGNTSVQAFIKSSGNQYQFDK